MANAVRSGHRHPTSGWLGFAGLILIIVSWFNIIDGLVALWRDKYYVVRTGDILVFNFTAWGWIWLILGAVQLVVGLGVLAGMVWARAIGVVLAALAMIGHLTFLAAYPVWSVLVIALCVLVIYGLVVPRSDASA
jgi:hypothetical protein